MEPISDQQALLERMQLLFPGDVIPGVATRILEVDPEEGTASMKMDVDKSHANQLGYVQGGTVATLLDGCIGIAGAVKSGGVLAMPLVELKVSFLRAVPVGRVTGEGRTLKLGKRIAFIEASLFGEDGVLLARASGTACPMPFPDSAA